MADAIETQTQQVTSETPATKPAKIPKRIAAGKATAEKTRQVREAQKKDAEEYAAIISANKAKDTPASALPQPRPTDDTACSNAASASSNATSASSNAASASSNAAISTTQWLAIGSFVVSLIGIYYKREEIKSALSLQKSEAKRPRASGAPPETTGVTPVAQQQESVTATRDVPSKIPVLPTKTQTKESVRWIKHLRYRKYTMAKRFDILQLFISTGAIFGIGLI